MTVALAALGTAFWVAQATEVADATAPTYETVVTAPPLPARDGSFALGSAGAKVLPGAGGDLGRALENAPGVARMAPAGDGLVLWGSTPQESRVLFDGVEIPTLFHFGGWRSVVPSEGLRDATVLPGGFAANFGRAIGGIVEVRSAEADAESHHAWLAADLLDTSVGARGPLGPRGGYLATARLGYLDRLQSAAGSSQSQALMPLPAYRDGLAKATVDLDEGRKLTVEAIAASDRRQLTLDTQSPIDTLVETRTRSFSRAAVRFEQANPGETTSVVAFVGSDNSKLDQQLGLVPVSLHASAVTMGAHLLHGQLVGNHWIELGVDGLFGVWSMERHGSLTEPPREGDASVFGAAPSGAIGSDTWHPILGDIAPYALAKLHFGRWDIHPGVRFDNALISSARTLPPTGLTPRVGFSRTSWSAEPRLAIHAVATPWLDVGASGGVHHQLPDAADLSPVFGSPRLGPSRAIDAVLSAALRGRGVTIESATFARKLDDLPVRNPDTQPALAQSLVQGGEGRSYGTQVLVRRDCEAGGACGLISYTLSRSLRRTPGDADWRLLYYDQTHVLTAVLGYHGQRWFAGARFRYATGMPRTPVAAAYYDASAGGYRPILGEHNSSRLPAFAELDLRAERSWQRSSLRFSLSLEVLNATHRKNPEEIVYSGDYARHAYVTGLPLLAVGGFRLEI